MNNDIYHGVISGLFGPVIARWATRFKYRIIFVATVAGIYGCSLIAIVRTVGWHIAFRVFVERVLTPAGVFAPIGCGLLAVGCVFISSIGMPSDKKE